MIDPEPRSHIPGATSWTNRNALFRLTSTILSNCASSMSRHGPCARLVPALFTRMSTRPNSRELLARVCGCDVSNAAFPFLAFRETTVGMLPAKIGRISFTDELGYEIWVAAHCQLALYEALLAAGADLGLTHFGSRALNSLRLEKSFGNWAREFRPIYSPVEAGLDRFVNLDKGDFVGRDAGEVRVA